ncbi:MAG: helix-turn-helix transcriptional regulator, partial [Terracidiphilus sp.]
AEMREKEYRDGYVAAQISLGLPTKIRGLRMERKWTQGELARRAKMAQPRISEIETPGERKLNLDTLQRIASAFDVGLEVDFVPFGELISRSERFDPDSFSVQSFGPELAAATDRQLIAESCEIAVPHNTFAATATQSSTGLVFGGPSDDMDRLRRIHYEMLARGVGAVLSANSGASTGLGAMQPIGAIPPNTFQSGPQAAGEQSPGCAKLRSERLSCKETTQVREKRGLGHRRFAPRNLIARKSRRTR